MKIHLPINLRKALLTAVFAVSAVAPQAQAAILQPWSFDALRGVLGILTKADYDNGKVRGFIDNRIDSVWYYDYCRSLSFLNKEIYAYYAPKSGDIKGGTLLYADSDDLNNYEKGNSEWNAICAWDYLGPKRTYGYDDPDDYKRTNNVEIGYFGGGGLVYAWPQNVSIQVNKVLYASKDIIIGDGSSVTGGTAEIYAGNNISGGEGGFILLGKDVRMYGKDMVATELIISHNFGNHNSVDNIVINMTNDVMSGGSIVLDGNNNSVSAGGIVGAYGELEIGTNSKMTAGANIVANYDIKVGEGTKLTADHGDISSVKGSIIAGRLTTLTAGGAITVGKDLVLKEGSSATANGEGIIIGETLEMGTGVVVETDGKLEAAEIFMTGSNKLTVGGSATTGGLTLQGTDIVKIGSDWAAKGSVVMDGSAPGSAPALEVGGALSAEGDVSLLGNASVSKSLQAGGKVSISNLESKMTLEKYLQAGDGLEITNTEIGTDGDTTVATGNMSLKHTAAEGKTGLTTSTLKVTEGNLSVDKAEVGAANVTVSGDAAIQNGASLMTILEVAVGGALKVDASQVAVNVMDGSVSKSLTAQFLDVEKGMVRVNGNVEIQGSAQVSGKSDFRALNKKNELEITSKLSVWGDLSVDSGAHALVGNTLSVGGTLSVSGADTKLSVADGTTADMLYVGSQGTVQLSGNAKNNVSKVKLADGTLKLLTDGDELAPFREYDLALQSLSVAGHSFLEANLIVGTGSELTFAQDSLLTMGCTVTIGSGTALNTESPLEYGVAMVLMDSVDGLTLAGNTVTADGWYDANGILATINGEAITESGKYAIGYHNGKVSVRFKIVPEPATATLSLLALAALAARRRRK